MFLFCFALFETCCHSVAQTCSKLSVGQAGLEPTNFLFYLQGRERDAATRLTAFYLLCMRPGTTRTSCSFCWKSPLASIFPQQVYSIFFSRYTQLLVTNFFFFFFYSLLFLGKKKVQLDTFL